jgi:hypothetical protein
MEKHIFLMCMLVMFMVMPKGAITPGRPKVRVRIKKG